MAEKYRVTLTADERDELIRMITPGKAAAAKLRHARILLKADASSLGPDDTDADIAAACEVSLPTIARVRKTFVERGLTASLERKRPTGRQYRKLDGAQEAQMIAVACSVPHAGQVCWTLKLLTDRLVELEVVESVSDETVRRTQKNDLKPWLKEQWVLPPKANVEFVCAMEDVLEVYTRPYDPKRPQVCLDGASKQLVAKTRSPLSLLPGQAARKDYEYERRGTSKLFMLYEPLAGKRRVQVTQPPLPTSPASSRNWWTTFTLRRRRLFW